MLNFGIFKGFSDKLFEGEVPTQLGTIGSKKFNFLLDLYPLASAAYSLRLLTSNYTGSAIRVRRANDNTEQNIGFDSNGNLDTAALVSFCSFTNGFIKTWYDQSGNGRDATQTTAANQPQIVSSGSVILENTKPSVSFLSGLSGLDFSNFSATSVTMFMIVKAKNDPPTDVNSGFVKFGGDNTFANNHYPYSDSNIYDDSFTSIRKNIGNPTTPLNQLNIYNVLSKSGEYTVTLNATQIYTTSNNNVAINASPKIGSKSSTFGMNNFISELIIYPSDQSSNRTGIESNINTFYSIY